LKSLLYVSDGQKVIVKNSRSLIDKEMTMNVSESKRQGWLNYLKKCEIQHIEKIYDDNENAVNLAYIEFNNIFIPQKTEITYSDTETSIKLFNVFDIPNNGKYTFSDEDKFVRIKQKCYIDDGIVGADGIEYYNHLDFELSDKGNFDEKIGMYKDYLPIDGISHELYYYPKEKYYNVYKCVISNSDEEDITFTVSDIYCASPYRYIIYKDNNYDIYSGTNSDGKSFDSISLENNKYYYVDNGNISKFYDSYDDAYSDVIDKGLDESTIYKKTDLKTEISFQDRKYSDFFYNDGIYPSFETEYTKMLNGEDYSLEGSDNIYIKTNYSASDYSDQVFLILNDSYDMSLSYDVDYMSNEGFYRYFNVMGDNISGTSENNYIIVDGNKYFESANSYYNVKIGISEYHLNILDETKGNIVVSGITEKVICNKDSNGIISSVTKVSLKDNDYVGVTYQTVPYGTYIIKGKTYLADKYSVKSGDGFTYERRITYDGAMSGSMVINEVIGQRNIRCTPIMSENMTEEEKYAERSVICSTLMNNSSSFSFRFSRHIFDSYEGKNDFSLIINDVKDTEQSSNDYINVYQLSTFYEIPFVPNNSFSSDIGREWDRDETFVEKETYNNIQETADMERDMYIPSKCSMEMNDCEGIPMTMEDVNEIDYNFHFRTRNMSGWTAYEDYGKSSELSKLCSSYFCLDYPLYSGMTNGGENNDDESYNKICSASDILWFLGFSDNDVYFQKDKLSHSFIRIEFYDSPNPNTQSLLFYSTIFLDETNLYEKFIKGCNDAINNYLTVNECKIEDGNFIKIDSDVIDSIHVNTELSKLKRTSTSTSEVVTKIDNESYRLSCQFVTKDRYEARNSSDGFYAYIFKDFSTYERSRTIYMKVEFNHAGYGKTVGMYYPRKFFIESGGTKVYLGDFTTSYATLNGSDKEYELYDNSTIVIWENSKPIYYEIKSEIQKDLSVIKRGYKLKNIYRQQFIGIKVIYDKEKKKYRYYLPFVDSTCYKDNKMIFNLWEIKFNEIDGN
jgi:hypothetical protein